MVCRRNFGNFHLWSRLFAFIKLVNIFPEFLLNFSSKLLVGFEKFLDLVTSLSESSAVIAEPCSCFLNNLSLYGKVKKFAAGASLVQVYSGLIYRGPELIGDCVEAIRRRREAPSRGNVPNL